jgi:tRNA-dihydrouridine synthase B
VRVARKHLGWYLAGREGGDRCRAAINRAETPAEQIRLIDAFVLQYGCASAAARIAA